MMRKLGLLVPIGFILLVSCSKPTSNPSAPIPEASAPQAPVGESDRESCTQAGRGLFGPNSEMLKCGRFSDRDHLEAVVAIRVHGLNDNKDGIPVSKLAILRRSNARWEAALNVDGDRGTNSAGFVGINFIDDSHPFPYYRAFFPSQWGSRSQSEFTLGLRSMTRDGKVDEEGSPTAIGWNPVVGRFQEIEPNGEEFAPETKAPEHIRTSK